MGHRIARQSARRDTHIRERCPQRPAGRRGIAWGLFILVTVLGTPAVGQPAGAAFLEALNLAGYSPGEKPPEFSGRTVEGQTLSLAGLRGRVVLLTFWATWCLPCREELPVFERLHRGFAAEGLAVVGVNVREEPSVILSYAKELGLTFPLVLDPRGEIQVSFGVVGLPTTFLVGRDGRAVARAIGARDWDTPPARALLRALLAESPR